MLTGYTCYIEDGKIDNAKDFIMLCTRDFGATIDMRDEPLDTPIPEKFEPDTYASKNLKKAMDKLEYLSSLTDKNIQEMIDKEYKKKQTDCDEQIKKEKIKNNRYAKVLSEVKAWNPPTPEHNNLKDFAINQIEMSTEYLMDDYYEKQKREPKPTVNEWKENAFASCLKDIKYYREENQKEIDRTNSRNKWLKELRESF